MPHILRFRIALPGFLAIATAMAQQPTFDAVSVKTVNPGAHLTFGDRGGPGTNDPGRVHMCCPGMYYLLMTAYDVEIDRLFGPDWIMENTGPNLYEIDATMPPTTTKARYRLMMQQFLKDRFHVAIHHETRNFPGYELVVAEGGPKLKESKPDPNAVLLDMSQPQKRNANGAVVLPPGPQMLTSLGWGVIVVQAQQKPLADFVGVLGRMINQSLGENPNDFHSPKSRVVDRTGLTATYDFTLRFSCELCQFAAVNGGLPPPNPLPADSPGGEPSIFTALQKQLGLKLNKVKEVPLDVIVVDRVEKVPTAN